jgi:hypothetical protein
VRFGSRPIRRRYPLISPFDAEFSTALIEFNREARLYCQGISDTLARDYAIGYARMLEDRAKGVQVSLPRIPSALFGPNRNLIQATLERMCDKYFQSR